MSVTGINDYEKYQNCENHEQVDFYSLLTPRAAQKILQDQNNLRSLTVRDIKKGSEESYFSYIEATRTDAIFKAYSELTIKGIKPFASKQEITAFISSERNAAYFMDLKNQVNKIIKLALAKFQKGHPFAVVLDADTSAINPNMTLLKTEQTRKSISELPYTSKLKDATLTEKIVLEQKISSAVFSLNEEKRIGKHIDQLTKRHEKSLEIKQRESEQEPNINQDPHFYLFLSAKLNKDLDKVSREDFESEINQKNYQDFKEKKRLQLAKQRELEIEESFLSQPVKISLPKTKGKKKKNKGHSLAKQEKAVQEASQIATTKVEIVTPPFPSIFSQQVFFLDKRITRWFGATHNEIKQFTDRVGLKSSNQYQSLTTSQLNEQYNHHNLPGVNQLMSLTPEYLQKYSTAYEFLHNGSLKHGRCFKAEVNLENIKEEGMIYIGVEGNRIYHAKFVSFNKSLPSLHFSAGDFCLTLDGIESLPNPSQESEWKMKGGYSLEMIEDTIVWSIGNGKSLIQYKIQPML